MKYIISYTQPHHHLIDIEFIADIDGSAETLIQLPAWRPGRYELGNFAKNVQKWNAFDEKGTLLQSSKIKKDLWSVQTAGLKKIIVRYNYFGAEINAGSTFLDSSQLYMNPVNCCVYIPGRVNERCTVQILVPENYVIAIGAKQESRGVYVFDDFHALADSPFIASPSMQHNKFVCEGTEFNLWFQGICRPDWNKLNNDFLKFCNHQLEMMKKAPFQSYHFLFQILPQKIYHGVEHTTSTVIALGPGYNLMKGELYEDLLGVSCHELYHAWNIKTIRPVEMQPYDYSRENYSKLGYVCEGVTTYYGDFLLLRSGVFNEDDYFKTLAERLQKHYDNPGRYNMSVADSSFDTWLDGYGPGIPNRKVSIYDEGNLLAFVTDIFIRKNSGNEHSLDDVMRHLYQEFGLKKKGYSDRDYKGIVEHYANAGYSDIFENFINGTSDYEPLLMEAMNYIGCRLVKSQAIKFSEHALGMKVHEVAGACRVSHIYPGSPADEAGIAVNDDVLAINEIQIKQDQSGTNFTEWSAYFGNQPQELAICSAGIIKTVKLQPQTGRFYPVVKMEKNDQAGAGQKKNYELWCGKKF